MEIKVDSRQIGFSEISKLISSGKPFYFYRLPNETECTLASDVGISKGIGGKGFVICTFDNSILLTLTNEINDHNGIIDIEPQCLTHTVLSTTKEEHNKNVTEIRTVLREIGEGKCVLSRLIANPLTHSITDIIAEMLHRYPNAFIFCYNTPYTGLWIGATPERLLSSDNHGLHTMSLAGTRTSGEESEWDDKNREEQKIVTDYIRETLRRHNLNAKVSPVFTKNAGPVEHLCQTIDVEDVELTDSDLSCLLHDLSPTPALGGYPKELAIELIENMENHPRECYGGFCGPYNSTSGFEFFVNLRSAKIFPLQKRYAQLVGGGITRFSDPDTEWNETTLKSKTLPL